MIPSSARPPLWNNLPPGGGERRREDAAAGCTSVQTSRAPCTQEECLRCSRFLSIPTVGTGWSRPHPLGIQSVSLTQPWFAGGRCPCLPVMQGLHSEGSVVELERGLAGGGPLSLSAAPSVGSEHQMVRRSAGHEG